MQLGIGCTAVSEIGLFSYVICLACGKICLHLTFFVVSYSREHKQRPLPAFPLHTPQLSLVDSLFEPLFYLHGFLTNCNSGRTYN